LLIDTLTLLLLDSRSMPLPSRFHDITADCLMFSPPYYAAVIDIHYLPPPPPVASHRSPTLFHATTLRHHYHACHYARRSNQACR
jgi:hypothetical protein